METPEFVPAEIGTPTKKARAVKSPAAAGAKSTVKTEATGERMYDITLHDSKEVPPNGQFIGVNGKQYILKPGIRTSVPASVLGVLDNAVHAIPEFDNNMRVIAMRNAPRLTYTLHRD